MMTFEGYKQQLLNYLNAQKTFEQEDIESNLSLQDEEKVEKGLLIKDAEIVGVDNGCYQLHTIEDNSKLRIGDRVKVISDKSHCDAKVIDLALNGMTVECKKLMRNGQKISIEVCENIMLDPIINLLDIIEEGRPGASFLKQLAGIEERREYGIGAIDINDIDTIFSQLDACKRHVIAESLRRPSIYCIQGPPGTGKTAVLSIIATSYAAKGKDVLVLANTHQAVNNALNRISQDCEEADIIKIGELLRTNGLNESIHTKKSIRDFLTAKKASKKKKPCIAGMTLYSAIVNMGFHSSGFLPNLILVDEAGQIPVTQASIIGAFGCGSIIFIGDDRQMPPIFHPKLQKNALSKSIFEYICERYPRMRNILNVTYRMNNPITQFISKAFYETDDCSSQPIEASSFSSGRTLSFDNVISEDFRVKGILGSPDSIFLCKIDDGKQHLDSNPLEAEFVCELVSSSKNCGVSMKDIAVITPYRRQAKCITERFVENAWPITYIPLVNTVECLQGQDVEMIVISLSATDPAFISRQEDFLFDSHRLNVMISRAKTKVVLIFGNVMYDKFMERYGKILKSIDGVKSV